MARACDRHIGWAWLETQGLADNARMRGKHVLLGVTGGIAAYKSAELVRRLAERGAEVQVVMTAAARKDFIRLWSKLFGGNRSLRVRASAGFPHFCNWAGLKAE